MKKKLLITLMLFASITVLFGKEKVKKHRDQIRINGFNQVRVEQTLMVEPSTGEIVVIRKDIYCDGAGDMKCKDQSIALGGTELDFENPSEYTQSEKIEAQSVIDLGDLDIDSGISSGSRSKVVQFYNVVTGTFYFRTFSYVWITNALGQVTSVLDISEKF